MAQMWIFIRQENSTWHTDWEDRSIGVCTLGEWYTYDQPYKEVCKTNCIELR